MVYFCFTHINPMFFLSQNTVTGQSFAFDVEGPGAAKGSAALRGRLRTWPTDWDGDGDVTSWVGQIRPKSPEKSPRFFHMKSTFFLRPMSFPMSWLRTMGNEGWETKSLLPSSNPTFFYGNHGSFSSMIYDNWPTNLEHLPFTGCSQHPR